MKLPIETRSLLLRHAVPDDAGELFVLSQEAQYRTWLPSQLYDDEAHAGRSLEYLIDQYSNPGNPRLGPYVLLIEHKADRIVIGHVGFSRFDDDVEIGFAIAERYQRRGLATEAIVAASRWAFATFGLERILGLADAENIASRRTLVRAGFAYLEDKVMTFQGSDKAVSVHALSANSILES